MESYLELGERLKEIRGNMGLSLEQVSALTGVSKTMLSQIESSKSIPTIATVFKIANGLKIKVDSLLCGEKKQYYDVININNLSPAIDNHEQVYMYCIFPFSPTFKPPAPLFVNVPLSPVVTFPVIFIPSTPLS